MLFITVDVDHIKELIYYDNDKKVIPSVIRDILAEIKEKYIIPPLDESNFEPINNDNLVFGPQVIRRDLEEIEE